jgi:hypothetical chaperone protein
MSIKSGALVAGLDFGTTNSVAAVARGSENPPQLVAIGGSEAIFRSALCFWEDDAVRGGVAMAAGPAAIREYLEAPSDSRFLQSFKSVSANASFESAPVFSRRYRFEDLGRLFLDQLTAQTGGQLSRLDRVVIGRPVHYAGPRPDPALARQRYDAMFRGFAPEIYYVYEPLAAAFSHASCLSKPATLLVADFGGGTSDFSVVRVAEPGAARRCLPLGHAGVGIAGDRLDQRIVERLVLPMLGKGSQYHSFGKLLDIPGGFFNDVSDWSKLALMHNRRTLDELERLRRAAVQPQLIGRLIALVEQELGFSLYDAVGRLKRALSEAEQAIFQFSADEFEIETEVTRTDFEQWIRPDLARMSDAVDAALTIAGVGEQAIDHVFLTGGTSLVPGVRALFTHRFGAGRIMSGAELTSIAQGLALIAQEDDPTPWCV